MHRAHAARTRRFDSLPPLDPDPGRRQLYRGFERKAGDVLGYNIIVVANRRYGLKRRSCMLGSILDLNVGSLQ
jgi:hypothetical protein